MGPVGKGGTSPRNNVLGSGLLGPAHWLACGGAFCSPTFWSRRARTSKNCVWGTLPPFRVMVLSDQLCNWESVNTPTGVNRTPEHIFTRPPWTRKTFSPAVSLNPFCFFGLNNRRKPTRITQSGAGLDLTERDLQVGSATPRLGFYTPNPWGKYFCWWIENQCDIKMKTQMCILSGKNTKKNTEKIFGFLTAMALTR